jgi:hypothetical protein
MLAEASFRGFEFLFTNLVVAPAASLESKSATSRQVTSVSIIRNHRHCLVWASARSGSLGVWRNRWPDRRHEELVSAQQRDRTMASPCCRAAHRSGLAVGGSNPDGHPTLFV